MIKKSIFIKLTAGFVIIALISMLAIGTFFINMFKNYTFTSKEQSMFEQADEISTVLEQTFSIQSFETYIELLDSFSNSRIWVIDRNGDIVIMSRSRSHSPEASKIPQEAEAVVQEALKGSNVSNTGFSSLYNETMLTVGVPVYNEFGVIVGAVLLHSPVEGIASTMDSAERFLFIGIIIASLLAVGLGIFYSSIFARPLKVMNKAAVEMAGGNYSIRTHLKQKDEIGQLSSSLDTLASNLGFTIDQLFQEKDKLNDIISSISEGLLAFDKDLHLINRNNALQELFEYSSDDVMEEKLLEDLNVHGLLEIFKAVAEDGNVKTVNIERNNKILRFIISPVKDSSDAIIGVVALVQDISESERLEQMRKDFVANVSHEFRTPLTVIRGSAEAIVDGAVSSPEDIQKYHKRILSETRGLERLVKDLLDLSRMQSGKLNLQVEDIDMASLAGEVVRNIQMLAQKKNIHIDLSTDESLPAVAGDYDRLRQLLIIFLDNAVKYSPENTAIHITIDIGDCFEIKIKDQGYGIPKEDLPYVWDRFYKADKSRSGTDTGTGLGLAIARHIVELHHGTVRMDSDLGVGTTVEICLPIAKQ